MTTRGKIGLAAGAVLVIAGAVVVLILMAGKGDPVPPAVTLVRYQPGESNAIIQIVNRNGPQFYHCWGVYDSGRLPDSDTATSGIITSREPLAVVVPIVKEAGRPLLIRVTCSPKRSGIGHLALSFFRLHVESGFETNLSLPAPPKTPMP